MTEPTLERSLGTSQAFALSLGLIGPTIAAAFAVPLVAHAAGRNAPLAYLLGGVAILLVGLCFVSFARRVANAGSAAAYVSAAFGPRAGFLAGWALLLTYWTSATAAAALTGAFLATSLRHVGVRLPGLDVMAAATVLAMAFADRDTKRFTTLILVIEAASVLAILVLTGLIFAHAPWSAAPFRPDPKLGLSGLGAGVTFAIVTFAGFEGAATLGEETRDPHRAVPLAIVGSAVVAASLFVVVSYAEVLGFGLDRVEALGRSEAPLDTLAERYATGAYGFVLDLAAAVSALGAVFAAVLAAARVLFAIGRAGFGGGGFGAVDKRHGVPRHAVWTVGGVSLLGLLAVGGAAGLHGYAGATATLGTLAIILVYMAVAVAAGVSDARAGRWGWVGARLLAVLVLCWPLIANLYPAPPWPGNLWPYVVIGWLVLGACIGWSLRLKSEWNGPGRDRRQASGIS